MNTHTKFDDIINSKFNEQEFPFNEENWAAAEQMIKAVRRKERRRRIGIIFLSGILLGALLSPIVIMNYKTSERTERTEKTETTGRTESAEITRTTEGTERTENTDKTEITGTGIKTEVKNQGNTLAVPENNIVRSVHQNNNAVNSIAAVNKTVSKQQPENNITVPVVAVNQTALVNGDKKIETPVAAETATANKDVSTATEVKKTPPAEEKKSTKIEETLNKEQPTIAQTKSVDVTNAKDSNVVKSVPPAIQQPVTKPVEPNLFTVYVAGGLNARTGISVSPIAGIGITKDVSQHIALGANLYYTYLSFQSGNVKTFTRSSTYGFEYAADVTQIQTNKIHYVLLNLFPEYKLSNKSAIKLGANLYYLVTSSNSVTNYTLSNNTEQNVITQKSSGYANGFNPIDIGLMAGYNCRLSDDFGIAVSFNYGLMDIKRNNYYNDNKFERNISSQLTLTYTLLKLHTK